jgi:hypothetical protein
MVDFLAVLLHLCDGIADKANARGWCDYHSPGERHRYRHERRFLRQNRGLVLALQDARLKEVLSDGYLARTGRISSAVTGLNPPRHRATAVLAVSGTGGVGLVAGPFGGSASGAAWATSLDEVRRAMGATTGVPGGGGSPSRSGRPTAPLPD